MLFTFDDRLYSDEVNLICGVDEAGRGPLAGPVVAAAVVLPRGVRIEGLRDSKMLTEKRRFQLFDEITKAALAWATGSVGPEKIDEINVLNATLFAMKEAVSKIKDEFDLMIVDGRNEVPVKTNQRPIVKGDTLSAHIAAASVLAKVTRDRIMIDYHEEYPEYNFIRNKGYGTREHKEMLVEHGPTPIHRKTFSGVREVLLV
ncbi:MAG: ribonuclease HII [Deltaproteobacteria bacterium]|uniref:Ribonuclease HII n=1 Tax=Candidatus Zymogenus saltonus TaxID=2844893 RepID=A0A9D8PP57_9DELT|nr:ribonuclease HII [Candidatus Zymogenus saltonus]